MHRRLDAAQLPADIDGARPMVQEVDAGVMVVLGAKDAACFERLVGLPDVAHFHRGDQHTFGIAKPMRCPT